MSEIEIEKLEELMKLFEDYENICHNQKDIIDNSDDYNDPSELTEKMKRIQDKGFSKEEMIRKFLSENKFDIGLEHMEDLNKDLEEYFDFGIFKYVNDEITSDEITNIDSRIKSCMIENPGEDDNRLYVKIWFDFKDNFGNDTLRKGRQEFVNDSKQELIDDIKEFMESEKNGWRII